MVTAIDASGVGDRISNVEISGDGRLNEKPNATNGVVRKERIQDTRGKKGQRSGLANDLLLDEILDTEPDAMILQWGHVASNHEKEAELHKCNRGNCLFTTDRAQIDEATAVSWYLPTLSLDDMPEQRPKGQLWVASMDESPCAYDVARSSKLLSLFNIGVSMSAHSHVRTCPYVHDDVLRNLDAPALPTKTKDEFRRNGTGLVAYIQSNCLGHRDDFVKALEAEGIQVDSFGPCQHNKDFPEGFETLKSWSEFDKPEFYKFERRYKFAIAFENCRCQDYVTEKLFRRLHLGVVPIYELGGSDTASWLPGSHSIINVSAFGSVAKLANELKRLDVDPVAYEKYLSWKGGVRKTKLGNMLAQCVKASNKCAICNEVLRQRAEGSQTSLAESPPFGVCPAEAQTDVESKVSLLTERAPYLEFVPADPVKSSSLNQCSCVVALFMWAFALVS